MHRTKGVGSSWGAWAAWGASMLCVGVGVTVSCASTNSALEADAPNDQPSAAQAAGYAPGMPGLEAKRATGLAEVGEAIRELENAGSSCDLACPQVAALRIGVTHLCDLKQTKDDLRRCKELRGTQASTEARLKPTCGTCDPHHETHDEPDADVNERPL